MTSSAQPAPESRFDNSTIFDFHTVSFDSGDRQNGSLYICDPVASPSGIVLADVVAAMREAVIWSEVDARQVRPDQRGAYKDQLDLVEAVPYRGDDGQFVLARFNHPNFPSDDVRWSEWLNHFDGKFSRAETDT